MIHEVIQPFSKSEATLTSYVIDNSEEMEQDRLRPAIIICPGGGYEFLSDREAEPIAIKMMSFGFQAFVLHYSIKPHVYPLALQELAASVQLIRQNHSQWHVDPEKIIVAGFSAGGHLAASLGVFWQEDFLTETLSGANHEWCPNGLLLSYPVLSSGEFAHEGSFRALLGNRYDEQKAQLSLEKQVSRNTPPTFLWHTLEDGLVPAENSLLFAKQLRKFDIPYELHIFPRGGHGLSLGTKETASGGEHAIEDSVVRWLELFADWVRFNI
ncbi:alpha/beta hydrolase [Enterococcus gallinarum]|nr:alpha/beta hydrolase [Enterococcus gallinarum]